MSRKIHVRNVRINKATGKLERVHKFAAGQQKNAHGKAKSTAAKWQAKSKTKGTK